MDSSLTLKLGCNHGVKRRQCRTAAASGPDAVVKLFILGFQAGLLFFPVSERSTAHFTSRCLQTSASPRVFYTHLSPTTLFRAVARTVFHCLRLGEHSGGLCVHVCVLLCEAVLLLFSAFHATSLHKHATAGEQLPTRTPPSSLSLPSTSPVLPTPPTRLAPPLFPLSERRVRWEDSIPKCNSLLPLRLTLTKLSAQVLLMDGLHGGHVCVCFCLLYGCCVRVGITHHSWISASLVHHSVLAFLSFFVCCCLMKMLRFTPHHGDRLSGFAGTYASTHAAKGKR